MEMYLVMVMSEALMIISSSCERKSSELGTYALSVNGDKIESDIGSCLLFPQKASFLPRNAQSTFEMLFFR